jgi:glycosyltransferase involved in cell wall biosynthesis
LVKGTLVSEEVLPYYFGAADIVLIQRMKILNSGNLPLSMFMGKVVVGPNVGNVGRILTETNNPTFIPRDTSSILKAVHKAFTLLEEGKGIENRHYALDNWSTDIISKKLFNYYKEIITLHH